MIARPTFLSLLAVASALAPACTAQNAYVYPKSVQERYVITTGDVQRPYESLGYLQISRRGALLFGYVPVVEADLQKMFGDLILGQMARAGADGVINLRFEETQYTTATRVLFAFPFFFIPLPTHVQVTGELVRFTDHPATGDKVSLAGHAARTGVH